MALNEGSAASLPTVSHLRGNRRHCEQRRKKHIFQGLKIFRILSSCLIRSFKYSSRRDAVVRQQQKGDDDDDDDGYNDAVDARHVRQRKTWVDV
ncbi:hypothetical protein SK128_023954 [Halocaridina rubra]|uniref:Uncharacterized protein n=1 Tax=Halocaridina rubra TaxID=373956 RepID=A0AAN8X3M3_HALRR